MPKRKHLIIGSGIAAIRALETIRGMNAEDEISLLTIESSLPYSPAILPYLVSGKVAETDVILRGEDYFYRMKSTFAREKEVVQVLPEAREVIYRDGDKENYDTLLIASGSEPVKPPIKGLDEVGFLGFHTMSDYRKLLQELKRGREVSIYGGGLVAMELATNLIEAGYEVSIIVRSRILRVYLDEETSGYIESIFLDKGAQIFSGKQISEIRRGKNKIEIALSDGSSLDTNVLIIATGVKPRLSFLERTGIEINRGVVVDRRMRTNMEHIYAAGDVTESPDFFAGRPGINPTLPNALSQGKIAGANMAGEVVEYEGWIPMNAFKFFDHVGFSIGLSSPPSDDNSIETREERNDKARQIKRLVYKGDRLVGALFLNVDVIPGLILYLIKQRVDVGFCKELLFQRPKEVSFYLMQRLEREETLAVKG